MSDSDNPYRAPGSELAGEPESYGGSIENTLAGNAELEIGPVWSEAWRRTNGIKGILIGGGLVMYAAVIVVSVLIGLVTGLGEEQSAAGMVLSQVAIAVISYPFTAGAIMLGLRHSVGLPVQFNDLFAYYGMTVPIVAVAVLQSFAVGIGFVLLVIPGIYLAFALALAIPLKVEKGLPIVDSLTTSLKLVNRKFLAVAGISVATWLVVMLSFLTIIGWIWSLPWMLMVYSITYRQLAGCELRA